MLDFKIFILFLFQGKKFRFFSIYPFFQDVFISVEGRLIIFLDDKTEAREPLENKELP